MPRAPLPHDEPDRLAALDASGLLDLAADSQLDDLARLTSSVIGTPIVLVSLVGCLEQTFIASVGFEARGTSRDSAFCSYTILSPEPLIVEDATQDPRFADNPLVTGEPGIRFYAGIPLMGLSGHAFGTLCVIDTKARQISESAMSALKIIARQVEFRLQLLQKARDADRRAEEFRALAAEMASMRAEAERLAMIARHTVNAVVITDAKGRIEWVNDAFTRMTEYTLTDVMGRRPGDFLQGTETDPAAVESMRRGIQNREAVDVEILNYSKSGKPYWLQVQIQPLFNEGGELTNFMAIELDITERKRSREELEQAKLAAEAASRAKSAFLANMSHEVRTPLTAILGYTDVVLEDPASPEAPELLRAARRNGEHLLTILSDVLDLSKMEVGRLHLDPMPCDPLGAVREAASLLEAQATGAGLDFRISIPERPSPVHATTDAGRLRQIVVNLVSNAIKFTTSGSVEVRAEAIPTDLGRVRLRCSVTDTGMGVEPKFLDKIFEPFEQGDASMSRRAGGTGLGLAISQRLARQLGGSIRVASEPGRGSTFTLELDLAPASASEARTTSRASAAPNRPKNPSMVGRILLVEDSPDSRRLIATLLQKAGVEVELAENGREAIEAIDHAKRAERPFDLVLMDMQMPIMDGYDATRRLRAEGYDRPILAITAHALAGDREACLDAGCSDYATKPIRKDPFLNLVRDWLHRPKPAEGPSGHPHPTPRGDTRRQAA